ncbi:hypothetical protein AVEN_188384-1 [Araneus ventricosus]|uniref:Uncharacterized protein n=1 Tax=Araneus ventricosus TaxID=182803 RepID=A0A4Y2ED68_ARAVE|nr:hypothetical protein AVEN_188384-1 [Araneus ventricosus]
MLILRKVEKRTHQNVSSATTRIHTGILIRIFHPGCIPKPVATAFTSSKEPPRSAPNFTHLKRMAAEDTVWPTNTHFLPPPEPLISRIADKISAAVSPKKEASFHNEGSESVVGKQKITHGDSRLDGRLSAI